MGGFEALWRNATDAEASTGASMQCQGRWSTAYLDRARGGRSGRGSGGMGRVPMGALRLPAAARVRIMARTSKRVPD